ncbi:hypothetical protein [Klebsiella quasipneumoniae]|uniref:hypothetical protein n=1 Tax=Klebsiella quasipneumoniae TaxID=1463165 RepID=UPI000CEBFBDE|nr:hypothetical protein [Klebsiella quasipneumoniae]ROC60411.1 hypothetical protein C4Z29_017710 [Klebsiella quasipneumoniae subsp. quasipneumoniae]
MNIEQLIALLNEQQQQQLKEATCVGCGCTDHNACVDENHTPCSWLKVNRETGLGICSSCPTFLNHSLTADGDKPEVRYG